MKSMNTEHENLVRKYIKAKDENKPHLMEAVFHCDATLRMKVKTSNISFPSDVKGLHNITDTLIREFSQSYENVYTICFSDTLETSETEVKCRWLVGMTERTSGSPRLGFGDYLWQFDSETPSLVKQLTIVIDDMRIFPQTDQPAIMSWLGSLPYPWAQSANVLTSMPDIHSLTEDRGH
jgi:hypothetical protein